MDALCEALGAKRGRPILLEAAPMPVPGPLGLWVDTPHADLILYQERTTRLHQSHIILHEVGHILADHGSAAGPSPGWETLIPGLSLTGARQVMRRCSYDNAQECEAELIASIIMEWASVLDRVATSPAADPRVRGIHDALTDPQGWL
ncbi:hypothetical protein M1P56_34910 (plasmid) [Streptomyces sp. HU2014]|uniref:hypothetical protein n=1 Tax=Streptomyces sp. HU2014 TaxID=2939414 RepID=UPI00200DF995|nr:hypothetical protein [Streptomyces sp. HU2014]UQI49710.1 hypothetical protein M1P56_34910 [Streptomyces sp. HU2014]